MEHRGPRNNKEIINKTYEMLHEVEENLGQIGANKLLHRLEDITDDFFFEHVFPFTEQFQSLKKTIARLESKTPRIMFAGDLDNLEPFIAFGENEEVELSVNGLKEVLKHFCPKSPHMIEFFDEIIEVSEEYKLDNVIKYVKSLLILE